MAAPGMRRPLSPAADKPLHEFWAALGHSEVERCVSEVACVEMIAAANRETIHDRSNRNQSSELG
jgi:hypothetical protein